MNKFYVFNTKWQKNTQKYLKIRKNILKKVKKINKKLEKVYISEYNIN